MLWPRSDSAEGPVRDVFGLGSQPICRVIHTNETSLGELPPPDGEEVWLPLAEEDAYFQLSKLEGPSMLTTFKCYSRPDLIMLDRSDNG